MTIQNIAQNQMSNAMMRLSSGFRVNSAADDAAGLAIIENMTAQVRGLDQGTRNTRDMQALAQTAEGGLETVGESLIRIRELSIQALNGINTPDQRAMIQAEIDQLTEGIQATVNNVQFNTMNLLDGSFENANTASSPDGTGAIFSINDMSVIARAMTSIGEDGRYDLAAIDASINQVNAERANLGALQNRFDHTANANTISSLNLVDARSRIADADIAREMMNLEQDRMLNEVQIMLQQRRQEQYEEDNNRLMTAGV